QLLLSRTDGTWIGRGQPSSRATSCTVKNCWSAARKPLSSSRVPFRFKRNKFSRLAPALDVILRDFSLEGSRGYGRRRPMQLCIRSTRDGSQAQHGTV